MHQISLVFWARQQQRSSLTYGVISLFLCCPLAAATFTLPLSGHSMNGVVVEEVNAGSALAEAGLQAGDVLLSWERLPNPPANPEAARGETGSVFDWMWLVIEQSPRGRIKLSGKRKGERVVFEVATGLWDAEVRPRIPETMLGIYLQGKELVESEQLERGIDLWQKVIAFTKEESHWQLRCWLSLRIGEALIAAGRSKEATKFYEMALKQARDPASHAVVLETIGSMYEDQEEFEIAEDNYLAALALRQAASEDSLHVAWSENLVGKILWHRGQLTLATNHWRRALEIQTRLAPKSLEVARSLNALGTVAAMRGELNSAADYFRGALQIKEKLTPESLALASSLNNLGALALDRGDLEIATEYLQRTLQMKERLAPETLTVARSLDNLGAVAHERRDLKLAEEYWRRSLAIRRSLPGDGLTIAESLHNLGIVAYERGDLNLAEENWLKAAETKGRLAPDSLTLAHSLNNLGEVAQGRGELDVAEKYYRRALQIKKSHAPGGFAVAFGLNRLGHLALEREELQRAEEYFLHALSIYEQMAPENSFSAETLHGLALLHRKAGRGELAAEYFDSSLQALAGQVAKMGGSQDIKSGFRAQHKDIYRQAVSLHLDLKNPEKAFHILERSRGQSFLAMLAERDLIFSADIPEELETARRRINVHYDRTFQQIADLSPTNDQERMEILRSEQRRLRQERDDITARIRRSSPRLAALQYPQALELQGIREALDPGTVMLSYSIEEKLTYLFAVTRNSKLTVKTLPVGEKRLRQEVEGFRKWIQDAKPGSELGARSMGSLLAAAKRLYATLIEPVSDQIEKSDRLLIIPDGPLHVLPFGALVGDLGGRGAKSGMGGQYLIEWKPIHFALSGTVYAELRRSRPELTAPTSSVALAAFGDPIFPIQLTEKDGQIINPHVRSATHRGFEFEPLPATRLEVEKIAELFPGGAVTYLGIEATEEQAKSLSAGLRYLHFATHGVLDEHFPLNSALVLTIPETFSEDRDNGLLQAWEIFERVRIDADLVVLSTCKSGLGQEVAGEGLIGLTRAFQYAGARSVIPSLWEVADRTTAELMLRFYRHLREGSPKDQALRAAQIELIQNSIRIEDEWGQFVEHNASAPYYWAAFQLMGDWQ